MKTDAVQAGRLAQFRLPPLPEHQRNCTHEWSVKMRPITEFENVSESFCLKCDLGYRDRWRCK
jgi:hypothetical protein